MRTKRKFSPKTAKRKLQYLIPNNGQTMSTTEYLVTFCRLNGYVPSTYMIKGIQVIA